VASRGGGNVGGGGSNGVFDGTGVWVGVGAGSCVRVAPDVGVGDGRDCVRVAAGDGDGVPEAPEPSPLTVAVPFAKPEVEPGTAPGGACVSDPAGPAPSSLVRRSARLRSAPDPTAHAAAPKVRTPRASRMAVPLRRLGRRISGPDVCASRKRARRRRPQLAIVRSAAVAPFPCGDSSEWRSALRMRREFTTVPRRTGPSSEGWPNCLGRKDFPVERTPSNFCRSSWTLNRLRVKSVFSGFAPMCGTRSFPRSLANSAAVSYLHSRFRARHLSRIGCVRAVKPGRREKSPSRWAWNTAVTEAEETSKGSRPLSIW